MSERVLTAYRLYHEGRTRFDYYVLGFIVAVAAYVGQNLQSARIVGSLNAFNVELASLSLLAAPVAFAFKRAELSTEILKHNYRLLEVLERRGGMAERASSGAPARNRQTGETYTPDEARREFEDLTTQAPSSSERA